MTCKKCLCHFCEWSTLHCSQWLETKRQKLAGPLAWFGLRATIWGPHSSSYHISPASLVCYSRCLLTQLLSFVQLRILGKICLKCVVPTVCRSKFLMFLKKCFWTTNERRLDLFSYPTNKYHTLHRSTVGTELCFCTCWHCVFNVNKNVFTVNKVNLVKINKVDISNTEYVILYILVGGIGFSWTCDWTQDISENHKRMQLFQVHIPLFENHHHDLWKSL